MRAGTAAGTLAGCCCALCACRETTPATVLPTFESVMTASEWTGRRWKCLFETYNEAGDHFDDWYDEWYEDSVRLMVTPSCSTLMADEVVVAVGHRHSFLASEEECYRVEASGVDVDATAFTVRLTPVDAYEFYLHLDIWVEDGVGIMSGVGLLPEIDGCDEISLPLVFWAPPGIGLAK